MTRTCKCGYSQEVNKNKTYQDIKGLYVICESCNEIYSVEIRNDEENKQFNNRS